MTDDEPGAPAPAPATKKGAFGPVGTVSFVPELSGAVVDELERIYGWCGLCRAFAEFPHDCSGQGWPAHDADWAEAWTP